MCLPRTAAGRPLVAVARMIWPQSGWLLSLGAFFRRASGSAVENDAGRSHRCVPQWEQQRLRLFTLAQGPCPGAGGESRCAAARTIPRQTLFSASVTLRVGARIQHAGSHQPPDPGGLFRASLVEGVGQFALRGGIWTCIPLRRKSRCARSFRRRTGHHGLFRPHHTAAHGKR